MNYLSPTPGSQDCEIDAKVVKAGRTLAFADVEIRNKKTGQVTARGTHIKFIPQVTVTSSGSAPVPKPVGTPKHANTVEAAESFISNMCSDALEGFDPESTQNFDTTALYGLKDITATPGKVVCTLPVHKRVQNNYLTLHGGCTGMLTLLCKLQSAFDQTNACDAVLLFYAQALITAVKHHNMHLAVRALCRCPWHHGHVRTELPCEHLCTCRSEAQIRNFPAILCHARHIYCCLSVV